MAAVDFGLSSPVLTLLAHSHNTTFRVDGLSAGRHRSFSLRLYRSGIGTLERVKSEIRILSHLKAHGVRAPSPVRDRQNRTALLTRKGKYAGTRTVLMCDWLEGNMPEVTVFRSMPHQLGREIARVHEALIELSSPGPSNTDLTRPHWDAHGLRGGAVGANPALADALATPHERLLLRKTHVVTEATLQRLAASGHGISLIHTDPRRDNVLVGQGSLTFIDFEGCGWGQPAYDLAVLLSDVLRDAPGLDLQEFLHAVVDGYRQVRELSVAEYEAIGSLLASRLAIHLSWYLCSTAAPAFSQDNDFRRSQTELLSQTLRHCTMKVFHLGGGTHTQ
ncbi:phosphotransferase enzyme family protein [Streptomyces asiaticus]|uniref:phosphotransferase enzyme family protein n=1 Tax=Streptomyces asiaticus TaxID=114695 RepID=UPI003F663311